MDDSSTIKSMNNAYRFADNTGADDSGIQYERPSLSTAIAGSGPRVSSHQDTAGHRGSNPGDCHRSTRQVGTRAARSPSVVVVPPQSGGHRKTDNRNTDNHMAPNRAPSRARCR